MLDSEQMTLAPKCRLIEKAARILEVSGRDSVQTAIQCGRHRQEIFASAKKIFEGHDFGTPAEIEASIEWLTKHNKIFAKQAEIQGWLSKREPFMTAGRFDDNLAYLPDTSQTAKQTAKQFASDVVDKLSAAANIARAGGPPLPEHMVNDEDKNMYLLQALSGRESWTCGKMQEAFQEFHPAFDRATNSDWSILDRFASLGQSIDEAAKALKVDDVKLDLTKLSAAYLASFVPVVREESQYAPTTVLDPCSKIVTSKARHRTNDPLSLTTFEREDLMNAIDTTPEPFMSLECYEEWLRTIGKKCTEAAKVREGSTQRDPGVDSVEQHVDGEVASA